MFAKYGMEGDTHEEEGLVYEMRISELEGKRSSERKIEEEERSLFHVVSEHLKKRNVEFSSKAKFQLMNFLGEVLEAVVDESVVTKMEEKEVSVKISSAHLNKAISSFLTSNASQGSWTDQRKHAKYFEFLDVSLRHFMELQLMDKGWTKGATLNGATVYCKPSSLKGVSCLKVVGSMCVPCQPLFEHAISTRTAEWVSAIHFPFFFDSAVNSSVRTNSLLPLTYSR